MKLLAVAPLRSGGRIRWIARILALLVAFFLSAFGIGEAITEPPSLEDWEGIVVGIVFVWVVVSMLLAWRWEKLGGLSLVLVGVALGILVSVTAGSNRVPAALIMSIPVVLIGIAFLVADRGAGVARREGGA